MNFKHKLSILFILLLIVNAALGQVTSGVITGTILDSTSAVIPGVKVVVTNESTRTRHEVQSQANGVYYVPQLAPGYYTVVATATGFKQVRVSGLKVDVNSTLTQDLTLQLGEISQTVEVSGQALMVDTTSGKMGATIQMDQVKELPLPDRNVFTLINLIPSAVFKISPSDNPVGTSINSGNGISVGGGRTMETTTTLDGVNNTRGALGMQTVEIAPPVDSVQEFKVEVNNLSAEVGRTTAGTVTAVTRGGTNKFTGTVYEYIRNDKLDAAGWGNDRKPPLRRNSFGAAIGGPIIKDKTFFFYNYDALRQRMSGAVTLNVGLPEWRTGNFANATRDAGTQGVVVPIYDPETGTGSFASPINNTPFPGNVIPSSRLDPVAVKAVSYYPNPNRTPNNPFNQTGNYQINRPSPLARDYHIGRLDHTFSESTKIYGRAMIAAPLYTRNTVFWEGDSAWSYENRNLNGALNLSHLFSTTFFMNATFGVARTRSIIIAGNCCEKNWGTELGLPGVPGKTFPGFSIGGGLVPMNNLGPGIWRPTNFTNPDMSANFTKVKGSHTIKFGVHHIRFAENLALNQDNSGTWTFDGHLTAGVAANGTRLANTGINMADFLLGRITSVTLSSPPSLGVRVRYYGAYIQDDFRVSRKLTLNLGLRYETLTPGTEVADRMSNFNPYLPSPIAGTGDVPAGALGAMTFQNRGGVGKYINNWDTNNFAPRLGFAYRVSEASNTVFRGGFGVFYGNESPADTADAGLLGFARSYSAVDPIPYRMRDGIPAGALAAPPESELTSSFGLRGTRFAQGSLGFKDPNVTITYTMHMNANLQHQWRDIIFEVGYLGNLGRKLTTAGQNINLIPPELLARTEIPERLRRPYTVLSGNQAALTIRPGHQGVSSYNAFTFRMERRLKNGVGWSMSYAFSKFIDDGPAPNGSVGSENSAHQQYYRRAAEKSLSNNHVPHRLVLAPIWEVPFGKGKRWLNYGGPANAVFGGWQLSTLLTMQSGTPFGISVLNGPRNLLGDASVPVLRPNLLQSDLYASTQGQPAIGVRGIQWLNAAAFGSPAAFTYGNSSRTLPGVLGPGLFNMDLMVVKMFHINERFRTEFRGEAYNMTNTPWFGQPASSLGGGNFGIATSASSRRIMQLGLKLYF